MYQIDNSSAAAVIPASTAAGTPGYFTDGNPATGIAPTILPAEFMNMVMMEILGVLSAGGVTPSKSNFTQLTTAIRAVNKQSTILTDTGAANIYAAANTPALTALPATGYSQRLNIAHANTGASTYAPDGLTAKPIYGLGLQPLQGGELPVGIAVLMYLVQSGVNGGNGAWIIIEALGGAQQVAMGTQSQHASQLSQVQSGAATYATDTGTANAIVAALSPAPAALVDGMVVRVLIAATNTGATTLNLNTFGALPVKGMGSAALQGSELIASGRATFIWAASSGVWILQSCQAGALQIAPGFQSFHAMQLGQAVGRLIGAQVFSTAGTSTYTPTVGTTSVVVEVVGAGGGGGGAPATGAGVSSLGAGGTGGTYAKGRFTSAFSGVTVTVGAGGAGGTGVAGSVGGTSSFGGLVSCPGGGGGGTSGPSSSAFFIGSVTTAGATGGNISMAQGAAATFGLSVSSTTLQVGVSGGSPFGPGMWVAVGAAGVNAVALGSGGSGTGLTQSLAALKGGNGAAGAVVVWEYS